MPVPDSDLDSDHACPRFARLELGPRHACPRIGPRLESCLSPIRISTRIMPVPDSPRLELGPCHACPRFGSRLESCLSPIRPARAWPMSCLSPIRPGSSLAHVMPVPDSDLDSRTRAPPAQEHRQVKRVGRPIAIRVAARCPPSAQKHREIECVPRCVLIEVRSARHRGRHRGDREVVEVPESVQRARSRIGRREEVHA